VHRAVNVGTSQTTKESTMQHQSRSEVRDRRRPRLRRLVPLAVAAGLSLAVAACGSSSSSSSGGSTSASNASSTSSGVATATAALKRYQSAPTKINITTPLKSAPPAGKTVVVLGTPQPQNVQIQNTFAQLAKLAHWNYAEVSYDPANPATFGSAVDTALTKHANYIVEAGIPLTPSVIKKVQQAGAKFVLGAVYPVSVQSPTIVDSDSYANDANMGKIIGDYFVSDSGGKGNAVIEHVPAYPILDGFTNSFTSTVKSLCPGCTTKTINVTIPQLGAGQLPSIVVSALRQDPSANYLVIDDGPFGDGITSALAAAGLSKVKIIGQAADPLGLAALRAGTQSAWTGFDARYQAYEDMDAMLRDAEGMPISQAQEGVQPTQLLTKANVGSTTDWNYPTNALHQFETLWKVSGS
jgi:ribose transport system substrate-binding protein